MSKKILVFDSKVSPFARSQVITLKSSIAFVSFGSPNNSLENISYADNMSFQFSMHEIAKKSKREITSIKVLELLISNPRLSTSDISLILKIGQERVKYQLAKLSAQGLIERVGPKKGGYWIVKKDD